MTTTTTTDTFAELGVADELVDALHSQGIANPFPIQALTIADGLAGRDVCGKAKTGSGKTLAFGVPLLQRTEPGAAAGRPRSLVLVPTRELAVQVGEVLAPLAAARGLRIAALYGGVLLEKHIKSLERGLDVVVATPGRLIDLVQREATSLGDVSALVLDEADRMLDMGFLPQVEWLVRHMPRERQTMLFSATLDGDIDRLVRNELRDPVRHEVVSSHKTVAGMVHHFLSVHDLDRVKVVASIAAGAFRTLVFTRTKRGADRLASSLRKEGVKVEAIHGDLRQSARERSLALFAEGKLPVLVATDVAARGIDVEGIDVVVHYDPPEDHKAYLHRSGRTARAGEAGVVVTLVLWNQVLEVEKLRKRLGLSQPLVEVFSNDPRLKDLAAWDPSEAVA